MNMLVTGGAGFIGSHVVDELLKAGHGVDVIDDLSGGFKENVDKRANFFDLSICQTRAVTEVIRARRYDVIYHLAAYAAEGLSPFIRRFNYENNLMGSVNLINAAVNHGVKRFVFTSSMAVYGAGQVPFNEEMTPAPEDPYGVAKLAVEQDLKLATRTFGLEYTIFRPHNVYGSRQNFGDRYRNVIGIFMNQIMQGKPMTIFGDGSQTRAFTHISDVAPIIAAAGTAPWARNDLFNVGSDVAFQVKHLAREVSLAMTGDEGWPTVHLNARDEVKYAYCDHNKMKHVMVETKSHLGLADGLHEMAAWAKKVGPRESGKMFIEISKGVPPSWLE